MTNFESNLGQLWLWFQMVEQTVQEKVDGKSKALEDMTLDELDEMEDAEDERILFQYR